MNANTLTPRVLLPPNARWQRTSKAVHELKGGQRNLSLRERACLLFADGKRTARDLADAVQESHLELIEKLVAAGYLEPVAAIGATAKARPPTDDAPGQLMRVDSSTDDWRVQTVKGLIEPRASAPVAAHAADEFAGRRSLATVRIFLLDLNQRMFSRRDPALAERFLLGLRNATDREAMLSVSREMLVEIEAAAGPERADSIAERLAAIVPAGA
jgi:hypothetical protein